MKAKSRIIEVLIRLENFFDGHNVRVWADSTRKSINQIQENKNIHSVLYNYIGAGMGSLLDLYICRENGHTLKQSEAETNRELDKLKDELFLLKESLRKPFWKFW